MMKGLFNAAQIAEAIINDCNFHFVR